MAKTELKLSYVIPAYNEEKHIERCLDSIYKQPIDASDYEVIVIDNCSTDKTVEVVEKYAKKHPNLYLIRQHKDHKAGASRNKGVVNARGEYINFIDADDKVEDGIVQAIDEALQSGVDILCARCYLYYDNDIRQLNAPCGTIMQAKELCEKWMTLHYLEPVWGKLFRREFLMEQNHPFVEDKQFEDGDWSAYHFYKASTVICSDKITYSFLNNPNSMTRRTPVFHNVVDFLSCGCRRKRVAEMVRSTMPNFSNIIWNEYEENKYIKNMLLRKLWVKFPTIDLLNYYRWIDKEDLEYLKNEYSTDSFSRMVLNHPFMTLFKLPYIKYKDAKSLKNIGVRFYCGAISLFSIDKE